jgi:flavin-dependent dehydrogenase
VRALECVIIGAGPAGSVTALLLARRGHEVLLVDQARFPRDKPCGEYLNPAAVSVIRRLGLLPALYERGALTVSGAVLTSPAGREVRIPYPTVAGTESCGLSIPRLALDAALRFAAEAAGARVYEGFRVDELLRTGGRVVGISGRCESGPVDIRAGVVIAADGTRSLAARRAGLFCPPVEPRRIGLVAHYEGVEGSPYVEMHAGRRGYCGLGYSAAGGANVAMVAEPEDMPRIKGRAEAFYEERLGTFPAVARRLRRGRRIGRVLVTAHMTARPARATAPGLLLVGDAAGFYDPYTGEGLSYALRGAEMAADAAEQALRGDEATAFRDYTARRQAEFTPRLLVSRIIQSVLRHPRWLESVFQRFETDPSLAQRLVGVTAGLLPPRTVLSPGYLAALLFTSGAPASSPGKKQLEPAGAPERVIAG